MTNAFLKRVGVKRPRCCWPDFSVRVPGMGRRRRRALRLRRGWHRANIYGPWAEFGGGAGQALFDSGFAGRFSLRLPAEIFSAEYCGAGCARGSAPEGMIPAYPSVTFPNHYTLVTGLYPEHHGIVANAFYDPARKQIYSYRDPAAEVDGTWYGGTPLWVLAEQQGMRSACFFWPGSEAEIQGVRPTYYMKYDQKYPNDQRVDQVLAWLKLPAEQRPHFITLYMSDVDGAGHSHGPDSPEVAEAVARSR